MVLEKYLISPKTLAIVPIDRNKSKVYEKDSVFIIDKPTQKIIEENCRYYGSSYDGRRQGTANLIGITHKPPILIEDEDNLIFFPTCSPRVKECGWIALNNVEDYGSYDKNSIIKFNNNLRLQIPISGKVLNNQVLRSTRLESVIRKRKMTKQKSTNNKKNN